MKNNKDDDFYEKLIEELSNKPPVHCVKPTHIISFDDLIGLQKMQIHFPLSDRYIRNSLSNKK